MPDLPRVEAPDQHAHLGHQATVPAGYAKQFLPFCYQRFALVAFGVLLATSLSAQSITNPPAAATTAIAVTAGPIAIVPLNDKDPSQSATVTGALEVTAGKAIIAASGTVTSSSATTDVILPHRGTLRVCAATSVKLASDSSVPAGDAPGLMMAMDHGAIEASFATGRNADVLLTPDFRILIGGPGAADVKVRLGQHGDTCVDNPGVNAPYVLVTSVFDGSAYRVQPGQRVMFQHGDVHEAVDHEKEPCGCPAQPRPGSNDFPMAQSAGLAPLPASTPAPVKPAANAQLTEPLVYKSAEPSPQPVAQVASATTAANTAQGAAPAPKTQAHQKKPGFFGRIGRFFRRIFGSD